MTLPSNTSNDTSSNRSPGTADLSDDPSDTRGRDRPGDQDLPSGRPAVDRPDWLLDTERDVLDRLAGRPLDFESMHAISNIYRAAAAVRRRAEREILSEYKLSWGGFTILWVLWVWGEMETARLASECGLAKGTLTGMLTTLGKRDLVQRHQVESDKRRVLVALTDTGTDTIDELFPKFNAYETTMTNGLTIEEQVQLARLLSVVIGNAR